MFGFARRQENLLKTFQLALGANSFGRGIGDVELRYLGSGYVAGVGYVEAHGNSGTRDGT